MKNGFVVGYGVVGQATMIGHDIPEDNYYDPLYPNDTVDGFREENFDTNRYYFICVPTPNDNDGKFDTSFVEQAIEWVIQNDSDGYIVIRSTVVPGTTRELSKKYARNIIHYPEFLTESDALQDAVFPELNYFGCNDLATSQGFIKQFENKPTRVSTETSEMIKYAMNTFFGMKVVLANILWDVSKQVKADYWEVSRALESHKWGSRNGWNPYHGGYRGFGGKCLPKDITALSNLDETGLLKKLLEVNDEFKKV